jgi:hypothetical protein
MASSGVRQTKSSPPLAIRWALKRTATGSMLSGNLSLGDWSGDRAMPTIGKSAVNRRGFAPLG